MRRPAKRRKARMEKAMVADFWGGVQVFLGLGVGSSRTIFVPGSDAGVVVGEGLGVGRRVTVTKLRARLGWGVAIRRREKGEGGEGEVLCLCNGFEGKAIEARGWQLLQVRGCVLQE